MTPFPSEYTLLTAEDVIAAFADLMGYTTQGAIDRLREHGGLEGALGRLQAYIDFQDADLATLAAVLAHGISEGQHFLDGNKRLAMTVTDSFIDLNGHTLEVDDDDLARWIIELSGGLTVRELAARIREHLKPKSL